MTIRATVGEKYFKATGETIGAAVKRLHQKQTVEQVAHYVGYSSASALRHYLSSRGLHDPWPKKSCRYGRNRPISDDDMREFYRRTSAGECKWAVAAELDYKPDSFRQRLYRKPEIDLQLGSVDAPEHQAE